MLMYFLKVGTLEYQINITLEIVFFYKLINLFGSGISKMFQKVNHHCFPYVTKQKTKIFAQIGLYLGLQGVLNYLLACIHTQHFIYG